MNINVRVEPSGSPLTKALWINAQWIVPQWIEFQTKPDVLGLRAGVLINALALLYLSQLVAERDPSLSKATRVGCYGLTAGYAAAHTVHFSPAPQAT